MNSTHLLIQWKPSLDEDFWHNKRNSSRGYKVYVTQISYPSFWEATTLVWTREHPAAEAIIGSLEEHLVYEIAIAATNNVGDGLKSSSICARMKEGGRRHTLQNSIIQNIEAATSSCFFW